MASEAPHHSPAQVQLIVNGGARYSASRELLRCASPVFARMLSPDWQHQHQLQHQLQEAPDCVASFGQFLACLSAPAAQVAQGHLLPTERGQLAGVLLLADKYLATELRDACEAALCEEPLGAGPCGEWPPARLAEDFAWMRWLRLERACSSCLRAAASRLPRLLVPSAAGAGRRFLAGLSAREFARLLADAEDGEAAAAALLLACELQWPAAADDAGLRTALAGLLKRPRPAELLAGPRMRRLRRLRPLAVESEWRRAAGAAVTRWFRLRVPASAAAGSASARMSHDSRLYYTVVDDGCAGRNVRFLLRPEAAGCILWAAPQDSADGLPLDLRRLRAGSAPASLGAGRESVGCIGYGGVGGGTVEILAGWCEVSLPSAAFDNGDSAAWLRVRLAGPGCH